MLRRAFALFAPVFPVFPVLPVILVFLIGGGTPVRAQDPLPAPAPDGRSLVGGRFTVEVIGQGPDVILIPGLASSRDTWKDVVPVLARGHRLHLLQLAGFAGTPAGDNARGDAVVAPTVEAIAEYIRTEKLKAPAVIGHSLGGESALMLAARHPDLVSRILVVDAYPFYSLLFAPNVTVEAARPYAVQARDQVIGSDAAAWDASSRRNVATLVTAPDRQAQVAGWVVASDKSVVGRALYELMTTDLRPELPSIAVPVTVIYAHNSFVPVSGPDYDARVASMYQGTGRFIPVRVDDSRHFVMFDQPERFASAVEAFLKP